MREGEPKIGEDLSKKSPDIKEPNLEKETPTESEKPLDNWVEDLTEEQKQARDSIIEGSKNHKTINLGLAIDKLLTAPEQDFWNSYINRVAFGEGEPSPDEVRRFGNLSVKLGLKEKTEKPQQKNKIETGVEKAPSFTLDTFDAKDLEDPHAFLDMSSEKPPQDCVFVYRGVKDKWQQPSLSEPEFEKMADEYENILEGIRKHVDDPENFPAVSQEEFARFKEIEKMAKTEGDQWFTDNAEIARYYAKKTGQVVRMAIKTDDIAPHYKETGITPGGYGNNFQIPREWFVKPEERPFLGEGVLLSKIAKGGSVIVYDIDSKTPDLNVGGERHEGKNVLKEYSQSQKNIEWLFGPEQNPSAEEQSKILQKRQEFAQKYYDGLPDFVLKSQFLVEDGSEGKPTVYEIQPKIENYKPATLDNVENIIKGLTAEQRASLAKELTYFIKRSKDFITGRNFPEGYEEFSDHIPDFQDGNVVVTSDGKLKMMDTNTYIDLNSREDQKDLFLSDIECFKTMLSKIKKSIKK